MSCYIDIHTHSKNQGNTNVFPVKNILLPLQEIIPETCFSAGWHPWHAQKAEIDEIDQSLREILHAKKLIALGECGLDRSITIPMKIQVAVFDRHLLRAIEYNKPVIIHCVRAFSDLLSVLGRHKGLQHIIIHGFTGNTTQVKQLLRFNCFFSIGDFVFTHPEKAKELLKAIPSGRLFFETDERKGSVQEIYQKAAALMNMNEEALIELVFQNFISVFGYGLVGQDPAPAGGRKA